MQPVTACYASDPTFVRNDLVLRNESTFLHLPSPLTNTPTDKDECLQVIYNVPSVQPTLLFANHNPRIHTLPHIQHV